MDYRDTIKIYEEERAEFYRLITEKNIKIGARVRTIHGKGEIIGKDHPWRFKVRIDEPTDYFNTHSDNFKQMNIPHGLCYFIRDLIEVLN